MLYKPNFCCNCGEKIERIEWNLLTSRRFCPTCAVEHRRHDHAPKIAVAVGSLAVMFGIGSLWAGSGTESGAAESNPASIRSSVPAVERSKTAVAATVTSQQQETQPQVSTPAEPAASTANRAVTAHFCGALTKKGTPCSRKVKARGLRCFQHEESQKPLNPNNGRKYFETKC